MKVLIINGSPRAHGNTAAALDEMKKIFTAEGVEFEEVHVGLLELHSCISCGSCFNTGKCVFDDEVNKTAPLLNECDGVVIGSPVHFAQAPGALTAFVSRLFYSTWAVDKSMKVGAVMVSARRSGTTATFDELNKFFTISQMPVVSGRYWNNVYGRAPGESVQDEEGMQNARYVARNMVFLMKSIALGKEQFGLPEKEDVVFTNFIR